MRECILCNSPSETINIGKSPVAGYVVGSIEESLLQPEFELNMEYCPKCNFVRYEKINTADEIISKMYEEQQSTYSLTGNNINYINSLVSYIADKFKLSASSSVLEIGCNDGALLKLFKDNVGCRVLGIEPSKSLSKLWEEKEITVYNEFFTSESVNELKSNNFEIIILRHVLEHIWDVHSFLEDVYQLMDVHTAFVIEVPYFLSVLENKRIDNVGYSHANYFTTRSINQLLSVHGMGIESFYPVDTDGGSMVVIVRKDIITNEKMLDNFELKDLYLFKNHIISKRNTMKEIIGSYKKNEVIGYGAGPKGQHLVHLLNLERYIDVVVNDLKYFQEKYIPGTGIIIKNPHEYLYDSDLKAVINLAPTHGDTIKFKIPCHLEFIELI